VNELSHQIAAALVEVFPASRLTYSSKDPPPDVCRRTFNRLAPRVRNSRKLGRTWIVDRAEWEAARQAGLR
jgi:hypothetical protein